MKTNLDGDAKSKENIYYGFTKIPNHQTQYLRKKR